MIQQKTFRIIVTLLLSLFAVIAIGQQENVDSAILYLNKSFATNKLDSASDRAKRYCDDVKEAYFDKIRYACDKPEQIIDDEMWPLVKYREMLFMR